VRCKATSDVTGRDSPHDGRNGGSVSTVLEHDPPHTDPLRAHGNGRAEGRTAPQDVVLQMQPILYRRLEKRAANLRVPLETLITTMLVETLDQPPPHPTPATPAPRTVTLLKANVAAIVAAIAIGLVLVVLALILGW
jgi:hypothetical protein